MGYCWFCFHGWPEKIDAIYKEAVEKLSGDESVLHWGPSHIVWEDENFDSAQWCLDHLQEYRDEYRDEYTDDEIEVCKWSLEQLLELPEDMKRPPEGFDDDDDHPEKFPPLYPMIKE